MCTFLCGPVLSFLGMELLDQAVSPHLIIGGTFRLFSEQLYHFASLPAAYERSDVPAPSPVLVVT